MSDLQKKIVEYVKIHHHADGIDVATDLHLPIDVAYREVRSLIDAGVIQQKYFGLNSWLEAKNA